MLIAVAVGCFGAALVIGWLLMAAGFFRLVWALVALLTAATIGMLMAGEVQPGWDALAYTMAAVFVLAPAGLGLLAGAFGAWLWQRRSR